MKDTFVTGDRIRHKYAGRTGTVVLDLYAYGPGMLSVQWDDRVGASPAYPFVLEREENR